MCTYRRRRAACPQGPTYSTYWVRVPASGVRYVPRTVAPQVRISALAHESSSLIDLEPKLIAVDDAEEEEAEGEATAAL